MFSWLDFTITLPDFAAILASASDMGLFGVMWWMFIHFAWIIAVLMMARHIPEFWLDWRRGKFAKLQEYVLLTIFIPRTNEYGPKVAEAIFAHLSGALDGTYKFKEKWWQGKFQLAFSFEIISEEGFLQYLIRAPKAFRDLVEASIYSQYPDVQINEVPDYTDELPDGFMKENLDVWGAEIALAKDIAYPIKTYKHFKDEYVGNEYRDPLTLILEVFSRLGHSEHFWMQLVLTPIKDDWKDKAAVALLKILGREVPKKQSFGEKFYEQALQISNALVTGQYQKTEEKKADDKLGKMAPGERKLVEAMEEKLMQIGYKTKFRALYWAKKDNFAKPKGVASFLGALSQFKTLNSNAFKPDATTKPNKWIHKAQSLLKLQIAFIKNYKKRKGGGLGKKEMILSIEELASLWHFPQAVIGKGPGKRIMRLPPIKMTTNKKAESPFAVPLAEEQQQPPTNDIQQTTSERMPKDMLSNLPFVDDNNQL